MKSRFWSSLALGLLLAASPPAVTLAACLQAAPDSCCCSKPCAPPATPRTGSSGTGCCELSDATSVPLTETQATLSVSHDHGAVIDEAAIDGWGDRLVARGFTRSSRTAPPGTPVALFTLHAAFLI